MEGKVISLSSYMTGILHKESGFQATKVVFMKKRHEEALKSCCPIISKEGHFFVILQYEYVTTSIYIII